MELQKSNDTEQQKEEKWRKKNKQIIETVKRSSNTNNSHEKPTVKQCQFLCVRKSNWATRNNGHEMLKMQTNRRKKIIPEKPQATQTVNEKTHKTQMMDRRFLCTLYSICLPF